jgi:hypothetical protein
MKSCLNRPPVFSAEELTLEVVSVGEISGQNGETGWIHTLTTWEVNLFRQSEGQEIDQGVGIGGLIGNARVVMDLLRRFGRVPQAVNRTVF